ncbi:DNA mismatch repair endonuclease MutL [Romboutsia maritimum]|uniref:DNA mismatch repair protein MutL n=1 Tax=Romboutsia maritimum TaxID=2020948 RepID=A0A371IUV4_9FIRM|nr:DNA mismatch repair endonuclease MutL [Romboutsia maritimum]RDY24258.1 DNA mismatch repair endonuclease MutL [Romboutsia maritimum]
MENKINILDDLTINKIAAGEVVERPSSVVKELIENCIDAKSRKIIIEIVDGGKKSIRITDNGIGIFSSEVEKSFLRHATSKIKKIDDLYDLYSLGFRGEALASISSVSKLEMITKTKEEPIGTRVMVEGGKIVLKEPVGCINGTTIIIRDIFYNTPVRQKFLKSTHAETINISDLINKLAIGNPAVQFKYINNNKNMLNTPGDDKLLSVVRSIYGKDITENLIEVNYECNKFSLYGYIGNNNVYRSNKNLQHIYINNRFVKSKIILDAINESYKSIIPINKHAVCFLNMDIKPSAIDVNIHPTKLEVKFEDEQEIYIELRDFLRRKLLSSSLIGKYETYENKNTQPKIININNTFEEKQKPIDTFKSVSEILNELDKKEKIDSKDKNLYEKNNKSDESKDVILESMICDESTHFKENNLLKSENESFKKDLKLEKNKILIEGEVDINKSFSIEDIEKLDNEEQIKEKNLQKNFFEEDNYKTSSKKVEINKFSLNGYNVVGSVFNTYIILQKEKSMYLLDQHAAHERVLYERYMDRFYKHDINMQMLLDPIVLKVSSVDMLQIESNIDLFIKFGFEIELFGNNHIMIRCVPTTFGIPESEKFILQIIDNIEDIKNNYELKGDKLASMACRAAIKANDKIYNIEIDSLLKQIEECKNPFTCPHGRPIMVEISKREIEKMFKRIM